MKKLTKLMAILMALCLITSSFVGSTLAKYVTSDKAADEARVAKFGVVVTAAGYLFNDTYDAVDYLADENGASITVQADTEGTNVVAPGTKNENGITFTLSGKPEVDVKLDIEVLDKDFTDASNPTDIMLAAKTGLPDMTTGNAEDTFDNDAVYYPVKFTLVKTVGGVDSTLVDAGTLADVKDTFEDESIDRIDTNTDFATEVAAKYTLTWKWDFETGHDQQDTLLGNLAAGINLIPDVALTDVTDYELDTNVGIKITVTQID